MQSMNQPLGLIHTLRLRKSISLMHHLLNAAA